MEKNAKLVFTAYAALHTSLVCASQAIGSTHFSLEANDPLYRNFMFDTAQILQTKNTVGLGLDPHLVFDVANNKATMENSDNTPANGFFLYKLQQSASALSQGAAHTLINDGTEQPANSSSLYGHLFQRLMQHLFIDLAGGYQPNENFIQPFSSTTVNGGQNNSLLGAYTKNWFASASALFTHTWKEFAFNANLGLTHAESNPDLLNSGFFSSNNFGSDTTGNPQNKVSFIHENAEVSYRAHSLFQPFIGGGLLQVVNTNSNATSNIQSWGLPSSLFDPTQDNTGYKIGGGVSLNYKQYMLRLEQQYFQRGNTYKNNEAVVTFKVNLG